MTDGHMRKVFNRMRANSARRRFERRSAQHHRRASPGAPGEPRSNKDAACNDILRG
jgi:hypothetical protein